MLFNLLSPISVVVGVVLAAFVTIFLWPVGEYGVPIAFAAFAIGAGVTELVRRLKTPPGPTVPPSKPKGGKR